MLVSKERYQGLEVEHYANIEPKAQCTEDYINVKQDNLIWTGLGLGPALPLPRDLHLYILRRIRRICFSTLIAEKVTLLIMYVWAAEDY